MGEAKRRKHLDQNFGIPLSADNKFFIKKVLDKAPPAWVFAKEGYRLEDSLDSSSFRSLPDVADIFAKFLRLRHWTPKQMKELRARMIYAHQAKKRLEVRLFRDGVRFGFFPGGGTYYLDLISHLSEMTGIEEWINMEPERIRHNILGTHETFDCFRENGEISERLASLCHLFWDALAEKIFVLPDIDVDNLDPRKEVSFEWVSCEHSLLFVVSELGQIRFWYCNEKTEEEWEGDAEDPKDLPIKIFEKLLLFQPRNRDIQVVTDAEADVQIDADLPAKTRGFAPLAARGRGEY